MFQLDPSFLPVVEGLAESLGLLLQIEPLTPLTLPKSMPKEGIYLLSEGPTHLYVGRSNDISRRLGRHCRPGATHRMAAFAFRLAREATGQIHATYKQEGSRAALMAEEHFRSAFDQAKARIRQMDVRFVAEPDPVRQTVLEVYAAVVLKTPYNDFDTH